VQSSVSATLKIQGKIGLLVQSHSGRRAVSQAGQRFCGKIQIMSRDESRGKMRSYMFPSTPGQQHAEHDLVEAAVAAVAKR
jgi:hypothetical protein